MGRSDEVGEWVGMPPELEPTRASVLRDWAVGPVDGTDLLGARIRLFSDSQTPTYVVVLGRLRPEFRAIE